MAKKLEVAIDKQFVAPYFMKQVKSDVELFKVRYTVNDLKSLFCGAEVEALPVMHYAIEAIDGGIAYDHKTLFRVELYFSAFNEIHYYCDWMDVDGHCYQVKAWTHRVYKAQEE